MKYFILFSVVCLAVVKSENTEENADVEEERVGPEARIPTASDIQRKIEEMQEQLTYKGYNNYTFHEFEMPLDLPAMGISGTVKSSGRLIGLLGFDSDVKKDCWAVCPTKFKYSITWPEIELFIEPYDLQGAVRLIQVFGKGALRINIKNLSASGKLHVKRTCWTCLDKVKISKFEINVKLDKQEDTEWFELTGWVGDEVRSRIISELVTENAVDVVAEYHAKIDKFLSDFIFNMVKDIEIPIKL